MKMFRSDPIVAIVILVALAFSFYSVNTPLIQDQKVGEIVFDESFHDFGQATEGAILKHTFLFKNIGKGSIKIISTSSSCGCTTVSKVIKEYASGESGEMEVIVDTVGKKGIIVKTVTVVMQNNTIPFKDISLSMSLIPPAHPIKEPLVNLNTDTRCKSCHLENGKGLTGIMLYHRVCSQCHGKKGIGASAKGFKDSQWQKRVNNAYLANRIRQGWGEVHMPSFVEGVTPALQEEQVQSLVKYLRQIGNESIQEIQ